MKSTCRTHDWCRFHPHTHACTPQASRIDGVGVSPVNGTSGVWLWCHRTLSASLQCDVQVQMALCFSGRVYTPNFSPGCWQPIAPPQRLALNNNVARSVSLYAPLFISAVPVGYEVQRKCWVGKSTDRKICRQATTSIICRVGVILYHDNGICHSVVIFAQISEGKMV